MGANAKIARDAYAAFGRGDIAAVIAMLDEKVEWTSPRTLPHGGEFSGPAQVGKFFEGIGAAWDSLALDVESVDDAGSNVIGVLRADGKRKNGDAESYGAVHVFDIAGGKIRRFREYVDVPKSF
jgi:ketosteroid isomerase-like protein